MKLETYGDRVVLEYKQHWFVWEPAWDMFRPVDSYAWDGSEFVLDDKAYCADPMDSLYGFGSPSMKQLCDALTAAHASQVNAAPSVQTPCVGLSEWWFDRSVALTPCAPRTRESWKQMVRGRYRTLRVKPRNKLTRRSL